MGKRKISYRVKKKGKKALAVRLTWQKRKENELTQKKDESKQVTEVNQFQDALQQDTTQQPSTSTPKTCEEFPSLVVTKSTEKIKCSWNELKGNRIINPSYVFPKIFEIGSEHSKQCTFGNIGFKNEIRVGLHCKWVFECDTCHRNYAISNEETGHGDMNSAGTWATVTSGIGFSQFENVLGVLDVPAMSKNTFLKKEVEVEKVWLEHIDNALVEAGIEERRLAIEKGDVDDDGMPFITVIVDGGWSKRSYGHNYTATSGVAVIIAERTGQLLFLGVRNKYCCICDRATKIGMEAKPHLCYKNWDENKPSTAMEQDIIVEGFKMSEKMHGVRYKYFVGDGDSSVYAKLVQNVSYGRTIQKLECANHCIKNYTGHLHKLAADKTFPPDSRKLLKQSIPRLTAAARGAIRHCADEGETVDDLISDLKNGPYHVFGEHAQCRNYFCQKVESNENFKIITNAKLFDEITALVSRLEQKAPRLIKNKTSNAAEFYMSLLAKYNCGKRINLGQRGSFQRRCYVAGLQFQKGHVWEQSPFKALTGHSPGQTHKKLILQKTHRREAKKRRRLEYPDARPTKRSRLSFPPDADYGPDAEEPEDAESLQQRCCDFIGSLQVTAEERDKCVKDTCSQRESQLWHDMRRSRLTASNFGAVCKRKDTTPCTNLVKKLLYQPHVITPAMEYGLRNEYLAIKRFEKDTGLTVAKCGLFVDLENGFLAASPDGLIQEENAVLEVKCVPSARQQGLITTAKEKKGFFLEVTTENSVKLRRNHNYFYQVQGVLNITDRVLCYLVVMTDKNESLFIEKIYRDERFWKDEMLPKLEKFYKHCLLPELVLPIFPTRFAIREPAYILEAQKVAEKIKINKKNRK